MSARVAFLNGRSRPTRSPPDRREPGGPRLPEREAGLFVVKDDKAVETAVTIGDKIGDSIEVREGVTPGEKVVLNPPKKLKNGSAVKRKESDDCGLQLSCILFNHNS